MLSLRQWTSRFFGLIALCLAASACGNDDAGPSVLTVPEGFSTIQSAVDAAQPGDLVLISPATYNETITIETANITLRGTDRNSVILDGGHDLINGIVVLADGVAVENLTVHSYRQNGVLFNGAGVTQDNGSRYSGDQPTGTGLAVLVGYRASYVTTYNNGLYGIYAFAARDGLIEHSLASGHPDSGFYIGQCKPCNVVITDSIAENNAIGYYGTNASGGVIIASSIFRGNRLGLTPNSQDMELLAPQTETLIIGNLVIDNDNPLAPPINGGFFGGGIAVGGGTQNMISRNRVVGHDGFGIGLVHLNDFAPLGNRVVDNVLTDNAIDLYFEQSARDTTAANNCFFDNNFTTSSPAAIETAMPCGGGSDFIEREPINLPVAPPPMDYRDIAAPEKQPTMPGTSTAIPQLPAGPAVWDEWDTIVVPAMP